MQIKTFTASKTAKLDGKVDEFLAQKNIVVHQVHTSMSVGSYMVVAEYEVR